MMLRTLSFAIALALCSTVPSLAQTSTAGSKTGAAVTDTAEQVKKWTTKQYNAAKAEWEKDNLKWTACRKEQADKKLSGRAGWSFLYECMKK